MDFELIERSKEDEEAIMKEWADIRRILSDDEEELSSPGRKRFKPHRW